MWLDVAIWLMSKWATLSMALAGGTLAFVSTKSARIRIEIWLIRKIILVYDIVLVPADIPPLGKDEHPGAFSRTCDRLV